MFFNRAIDLNTVIILQFAVFVDFQQSLVGFYFKTQRFLGNYNTGAFFYILPWKDTETEQKFLKQNFYTLKHLFTQTSLALWSDF